MPLLDVSDVLTDPDFVQFGLICTRNIQIVGEDGLAVNTPTLFNFTGVVTSESGERLNRIADGERITGSILICTRFRLIDGKIGKSADIVTIPARCCNSPNALQYTVAEVNNYSRYGLGFVEALCDLVPLHG